MFLDILNNTQPEYDENVYVYIKPLTDGIRMAVPSSDSGLMVGVERVWVFGEIEVWQKRYKSTELTNLFLAFTCHF